MIRSITSAFKRINVKNFSKVCDPYRKLQRMIDLERNIKINPMLQHEKFVILF